MELELLSARKAHIKLVLRIAILAASLIVGVDLVQFISSPAEKWWLIIFNDTLPLPVYIGIYFALGSPRVRTDRLLSLLVWLAILVTEISFIGSAFLVSGLEVFYALASLALITIASRPPALLPTEHRWAIALALVSSLVMLLPRTFQALPRLPVPPLIVSSSYIILWSISAAYIFLLLGVFSQIGLRIKLALGMLMVSLISIVVIAFWVGNIAEKALRSRMETMLAGAAAQVAAQLDTHLSNNIDIVRSQAQLPLLRAYLLGEKASDRQQGVTFLEIGQTLLSFQARDAHIVSYGLLNARGIVVADTVARNIGKDESSEDYFQKAMSGISNVSDLRYRGSPPALVLAFAAPVKDAHGRPIGVLRFWLSSVVIAEMIAANTELVAASSFAMVVDSNEILLGQGEYPYMVGYFIREPAPARLNALYLSKRLLPGVPIRVASLEGLVEGLEKLGEEPLFSVRITEEEGVVSHQEWMTARRMSILPWMVVYYQEEASFTRLLRAQQNQILMVSLILMATMSGVGILFARSIVTPIQQLTEAAKRVQEGDLNVKVEIASRDESGLLAQAFQQMINNTRELLTNLEARVQERTAELAERSNYLQAVAEVGRLVFTLRDPQVLMAQVVEVVRARFGLYYVGLFEVDGSGEWAVLRAGSGEAGKAMLARGHRIRVGSGMVGWSIAHNQPRIAQQAELDAVRLRTPELPETRSEAALPLRTHSGVIGALTIQSDRPHAFNPDNLAVFQILADLIASALENARLYADMQSALHSMEHIFSERVRRTLEEYFHVHKSLTYRSDGTQVWEDPLAWYPEMEEAIRLQQPVTGALTSYGQEQIYPLAIPLILREQVVGAMRTYKPAEKGPWTAEEIEVINNIIEQIALTLEAAQLYEQSQQRATYERVLSEITTKVWSASGIEAILQTTVRELGRALNASEIEIAIVEDQHEK